MTDYDMEGLERELRAYIASQGKIGRYSLKATPSAVRTLREAEDRLSQLTRAIGDAGRQLPLTEQNLADRIKPICEEI